MSVMIRSKYLPAVSATMVLLLATLVPTPIRGAEPPLASASPGPGASAQRPATRADAVALVLATDPRFADLHDWEALRLRSASEFKPHILIESYYRVLPTTGTDLASWEIVERVSGSWLIAVTLVKDCVEPLSDSAPMAADPCGWRHSWTYRVQPDGVVALLFDEGDPDEDAESPPLVGTEWTLRAIGTSRVGDRLAGDPAWVTFAADSTVSGFAGCNVFTGPFTTAGSSITIGPLRVTGRSCATEVMEVEAVLLEVLEAAPTWWISGDLLKLGSDDLLSPLADRTLTFQAAGPVGG